MNRSLLPGNASSQEVALDLATARIEDIPVPLRRLWNPATCPAAVLPWLAWALSVDNWDPSWPESTRRAVILASIEVHRRKGTVGAIRRALVAAGFGDATLIEKYGRRFFDGTIARTGAVDRSEPDHWAEYRVVLLRPISNAQAAQVRSLLGAVAPLRCRLRVLDFLAASNLYNGAVPRDGSFNRGTS